MLVEEFGFEFVFGFKVRKYVEFCLGSLRWEVVY